MKRPVVIGLVVLLLLIGTQSFASSSDTFAPGDLTGAERKRYVIDFFGPKVARAVRGTGIFASVAMAQLILETGWVTSTLAIEYKNLFGVKATSSWTGQVSPPRWDAMEQSYAQYRAYPTYEDSIKDYHNKVLMLSRYASARQAPNPAEQARRLKAAGYATDPNYANKLIEIMDLYDLYRFDA
jgi:flagellum-specific peptidoglycan hydrolase FlgJ